jgi:hypothetical protein
MAGGVDMAAGGGWTETEKAAVIAASGLAMVVIVFLLYALS